MFGLKVFLLLRFLIYCWIKNVILLRVIYQSVVFFIEQKKGVYILKTYQRFIWFWLFKELITVVMKTLVLFRELPNVMWSLAPSSWFEKKTRLHWAWALSQLWFGVKDLRDQNRTTTGSSWTSQRRDCTRLLRSIT